MVENNKMEIVTADALAYFRSVSEDTELGEEKRKFASGFRDILKKVTELGKNNIVRQYLDSKAGADVTRKT